MKVRRSWELEIHYSREQRERAYGDSYELTEHVLYSMVLHEITTCIPLFGVHTKYQNTLRYFVNLCKLKEHVLVFGDLCKITETVQLFGKFVQNQRTCSGIWRFVQNNRTCSGIW